MDLVDHRKVLLLGGATHFQYASFLVQQRNREVPGERKGAHCRRIKRGQLGNAATDI